MNRKLYTFLIVAPQGKLRKIQIPQYVAPLLAVLSFAGVIALAVMADSYARMLLKVANYNEVRNEREALKSQNHNLEQVVTHTNAKLTSLESLAGEVALTYGFGGVQRPRFPQALLTLATQSDSTLESGYGASVYAFGLLRGAASNPRLDPAVQSFLSIPRLSSVPLSSMPFPGYNRAMVPSMWPVRGEITGGFGQRMDPLNGEASVHWGIDISAPSGTEVQVTADGVVLRTGFFEAGYGNEILVDHGGGIVTKYGHLSRIDVVSQQQVKKGQIIGAVGMTGRSTGPHLHYEVLVNQVAVNPAKYLGSGG
jgi:murein DD-endopeptidase MepM/ murein hydrolase activator NlpD